MEKAILSNKKGIKEEKVKRKYDKNVLSIREKAYIKAFTEVGATTYGLARESALKAGYVEKFIEHSVARLMANSKVLIAIDEVYAKKMESTPTNLARVMSNLDNTEAIALKAKSMPTLTKITELRGKYLDIFSANNSAPTEWTNALNARVTEEQKKICCLVANILLEGNGAGTPQRKEELRRMIMSHPELVFPEKVKKAAG